MHGTDRAAWRGASTFGLRTDSARERARRFLGGVRARSKSCPPSSARRKRVFEYGLAAPGRSSRHLGDQELLQITEAPEPVDPVSSAAVRAGGDPDDAVESAAVVQEGFATNIGVARKSLRVRTERSADRLSLP